MARIVPACGQLRRVRGFDEQSTGHVLLLQRGGERMLIVLDVERTR
jgi:hypothetical protein